MTSISPSHRRLQPLASSIDRHFEQYLNDYHHFPKLPAIHKFRSNVDETNLTSDEFVSPRSSRPVETTANHGPISQLLNSDAYRRAQARLIEYRQQSKIPGIALTPTHEQFETQNTGRHEFVLPLKEVVARTKQHEDGDGAAADDDSVCSDEGERRRRAKHWIHDHQFFFTEY